MASKKTIQSSVAGVETDAIPESPFFRNAGREEKVREVRHMNGEPIPDELYELIPYANTDEGIAERLAKPHAFATVTRDNLSKRIEEFGEGRLAGMQPWEAPDPMREVIDEHVEAGQRSKFLSDRVVKRQGLRGWKPVVKNGDPVKLGELILATMPEEKAVQRNRTYQAKGQQQVDQIRGEFQEKQEREFRDAGMRPEALGSQRDGFDSGLHSTRGEFSE